MTTTLIWLLAILFVLTGLFALACLPHNLRIRRVRKAYQTLPADVIAEVLAAIERLAAKGPAVTLLRLGEEIDCSGETLLGSHVGGIPYAEAGEKWPEVDDDPGKFLLQVRLDHPDLGEPWQGRLIVAYLRFDFQQAVRSFAAPSSEKYVAIESPRPVNRCFALQPLRFPAGVGERAGTPLSPERLCAASPEIVDLLQPHTADPAGLLTQILRPNFYGYDLETSDVAYVGGEPSFIQNPHEPVCDECRQPLRFLYQFGEIMPELKMADGGVYYVYGCDQHPDRCQAFVDTF